MGMRTEFHAEDLLNVVSSGAVSRRNRLVFTANPLHVHPLDEEARPPPSFSSTISPVSCLRLSRDERYLAVGTGDVVKLMEVSTGKEARNLIGHRRPILAICPANRTIYSWITGSEDNTCVVWDVRKHPANQLTIRTPGSVRTVHLSPDDSLLAIGTDFSLQLFDLRNRLMFHEINNVSVLGASFHPSECLLATYGADRVVRFWDLDTFECVCISEPAESDIKSVAFVPNGDLLMTSTDAKLRLMTWEPCNILATVDLPTSSKVVNVFSSDNSVDILCSFSDRSVSLFSTTYEEALTVQVSDDFGDLSIAMSSSVPGSPLRVSSSQGSDGVESADSERTSTDSPIEEEAESSRVFSVQCQQPQEEVVKERYIEKKPPIVRKLSRFTEAASTSASTVNLSTSNNKAMGGRPNSARRDPITTKSALDLRSKEKDEPRKMSSTLERRTDERRTSIIKEREAMRASRDRETRDATLTEERVPSTKVSEENLLNFIVSRHVTILMDLDDKQRSVNRLKDQWKRRGVEEAVTSTGNDRFLITQVIKQLTLSNKWTIALSAQMLPKIRTLLIDRSSFVRQIGLQALSKILTQLGDPIRGGARQAPSIGVDVTGELRRENAIKCNKLLLDMQINFAFLTDHMTPSQIGEFDAIMSLIDVH